MGNGESEEWRAYESILVNIKSFRKVELNLRTRDAVLSASWTQIIGEMCGSTKVHQWREYKENVRN